MFPRMKRNFIVIYRNGGFFEPENTLDMKRFILIFFVLLSQIFAQAAPKYYSGSLTLKNQKYLIEFVQNSFFCQI